MRNLKKINVMITGSGAPGTKGTVYSLRKINKMNLLIGVDKDNIISTSKICDKFYKVPRIEDKNYLKHLLNIAKINNINIILPQTTNENIYLSKNKNYFKRHSIEILSSNFDSIKIANDKYNTNKEIQKLGFKTPKIINISSKDEVIENLKLFQYPAKQIVLKPRNSFGKRGFLILSEKKILFKNFINEKDFQLTTNIETFKKIFPKKLPDMLMMEFLPGKEYSVDMYVGSKKIFSIPRVRKTIRSGISHFTYLEKNKHLINLSTLFARHINYEGILGMQFKDDSKGKPMILECNPRVQGSMVISTISGANLIKMAIEEKLINKINHNCKINWNTSFERFYGGYGFVKNKYMEV